MRVKIAADRISNILCKFSCIAIAVMMLLMVADAFGRKIVGSIPGGFYTNYCHISHSSFYSAGICTDAQSPYNRGSGYFKTEQKESDPTEYYFQYTGGFLFYRPYPGQAP